MPSKSEWADLVNRAVWTFLQTATSVLAAAGTGFVEMDVWQAAAISGAASSLSAVKTWVVMMKARKAPEDVE